MQPILRRWNNEFFRKQLSDQVLKTLAQLDYNNQELIDFLTNHFNWLYLSGFDPYDFSPQAAQWYATETLAYLPSALQIIPPVTIKDRLAEIDNYVFSHYASSSNEISHNLLDIGCGYPPYTTMEFSKKFPNFFIDAIDPNLPAYILFDQNRENAACFDKNKDFVYLQCSTSDVREKQRQNLYTKLSLEWSKIKDLIGTNSSLISSPIENDLLIIDPMAEFACNKVKFFPETFEQFNNRHKYDLIRCFNVLMYYDRKFYFQMLLKIKQCLKDGGRFLHGCIDPFYGIQFHYMVIERRHDELLNKRLVFSIDHISPAIATYAWLFYRDNPDSLLLVKVLELIASDRVFYSSYVKKLDQLLADAKLAVRDNQGYRILLSGFYSLRTKTKLQHIYKAMLKEFAQKLITLLKKYGIITTINNIGHISIDIPSLPTQYVKLLQ